MDTIIVSCLQAYIAESITEYRRIADGIGIDITNTTVAVG